MSEFKPADVGLARRTLSDPLPVDPDIAAPDSGDAKPEREGLPSSYRMRADPHYVELLTSHPGRPERSGLPTESPLRQRRAADIPAAEGVRAAYDPRSERLLAELAEDLSTIASSAAVLATDPPPMARRVNIDLIRAQAWRASWLLNAHGLLGGTHRARVQPQELGGLLARVRDGFGPECRLTGSSIELNVPAWNLVVPVDGTALEAGISGAVIWTLAATGQAEGAVITVSAEVTDGRLDALLVSQESAYGATPTPRHAASASAPGSDEWIAAQGASVAKAAARLHGGDAAFLAGDGPGSTVRFTLRDGRL